MLIKNHFGEALSTELNQVLPALLTFLDFQVDAILEYDFATNDSRMTYKSDYLLLNHSSGDKFNSDELITLLHPGDKSRVLSEYIDFLNSDEPVFKTRTRAYLAEQGIFYVEVICTKISNSKGRPSKLITLVKDYTNAQFANKEIEELTMAIRNSMSGIAWLDRDKVFRMVRDDYAGMLGYTPSELIGTPCQETVFEEDIPIAEESFHKMLMEGKAEVKLRGIKKDGRIFHKSTLIVKTFDENGIHNGHYCMMKDITAEINYEKALKKSNDELAKTNAELNNLLYRVSHDLRSPLMSTLGLTHLMSHSTDEAEINKYALLQYKSLVKLEELITNISDYSANRCEDFKVGQVKIDELINTILSDELGEEHQFNVEVNLNRDVDLVSDEKRIATLLRIFVRNAIDFHDPEEKAPVIKIAVNIEKHEVRLVIQDNGLGIDSKYHEQIFDMFFRGHKNSRGAGLGLFLARDIIDKLDGTIKVDSVEGIGSKFTCILRNYSTV